MPRPRREFCSDRGAADTAPQPRSCDHSGCDQTGDFRAPKSRAPGSGHYWFCLDHVRDYNAAWNFFAGMSQREIEDYQHGNATWHRPTWRIGLRPGEVPAPGGWYDPMDLLNDTGLNPGPGAKPGEPPARPVGEQERRALADLDLGPVATLQEIKARYKQLVKRFHPDTNGGDKAAEERLKQINQSYTYLLSCGYI